MNRFLMMTLVFLGLICPNVVLSADDAFMSRKMVYVSSRGLPQHPSGTVWGLVNRCLSPKATKSWEILSDNARILHLVTDDAMTGQRFHTKMLFEVLGNNKKNVFVSRVVVNGVESFEDRDAVFGSIVMNCLHEDKTGTALPMYGDAAPKRQEPKPDEYDDYTPEIPFGEDGAFCGFVVDHRIHPRELVGLLVLENIEKTKKVTVLYDSKDERHLCREVINSNAERGSMMCVDTEERPNNFGLDKIGVHMSTILWGTYCSVPD